MNYSRMLQLLEKGVAERHYSYKDTGIITCIATRNGNEYGVYAYPDDTIEVCRNGSFVSYGTITKELKHVRISHSILDIKDNVSRET